MDLSQLNRISETEWQIPATGRMRVPGTIFADETLIRAMDDKVREQVSNVASLPGVVKASFALPDAHWGYGFPIGGVAAFDPDEGGVISAGGVGFDISCGVRTMLTGITGAEVGPVKDRLADILFRAVPAGLGSKGDIRLNDEEMSAMLAGGARWALERGYGEAADRARIEEGGYASDARPAFVSSKARQRQHAEMGTLGSGNHYLEVQGIAEIFDPAVAAGFGLQPGEVVITIHCGSRGLGHQIGTEFLREMTIAAEAAGIALPERELACAPIRSEVGERYLGAMRAGINCALANRQIIGHLAREAFAEVFPRASLPLLFDVSHNTCKVEAHQVNGGRREVYVHRKGATRAFGPGHPDLPEDLRAFGQPVLIGGSMGTESWVLVGTPESEARAFSSAVHGAGRAMSRHQAARQWQGRELIDSLRAQGIVIRSHSARGVAEEAPGAYKDVGTVVAAAERAGLARRVARLRPLISIKG
jgi:tRNA-splicing ligase RtcB (3'-phosphate/5'-hydroxy nucleic acid ligase)